MASFEGVHYLLVALGDGSLIYFNLTPETGKACYKFIYMYSYETSYLEVEW